MLHALCAVVTIILDLSMMIYTLPHKLTHTHTHTCIIKCDNKSDRKRRALIPIMSWSQPLMLIAYALWCDIHNECKHIRNYSIYSIHSKCVNINKFESCLAHWRDQTTTTLNTRAQLSSIGRSVARAHIHIQIPSHSLSFVLSLGHIIFVRSFCFFFPWSDYIYFVAFVILIIVVTAHIRHQRA